MFKNAQSQIPGNLKFISRLKGGCYSGPDNYALVSPYCRELSNAPFLLQHTTL
jgi:hypothetical protein